MKTYDDSVKLHVLRENLDSEYKSEKLTDKQIIERRWKKTEQALAKAVPLVRKAYRQIGDELLDLLKAVGFTHENLSKHVSAKTRRLVTDKIEEWREAGILTGYLKFLTDTNTWTNKSVLNLLICGLYASKYQRIKSISNDVFAISAVDAYSQSIADRKVEYPPFLGMAVILSFAVMPVLQNTYVEYIDSLLVKQVGEMDAFVATSLMVGMDENALFIRLVKQANAIIKVNKGKYSGGLDDATRAVANKAYTYKADQQVRFVAEMDEKTTRMCRSLNGQLFYTNKTNTFKRYSASHDSEIEVTCEGLVLGLNMPPIMDHFHWCRSTLTYQI